MCDKPRVFDEKTRRCCEVFDGVYDRDMPVVEVFVEVFAEDVAMRCWCCESDRDDDD